MLYLLFDKMSWTSDLKSIAFTSSPVFRDHTLTVENGQEELDEIKELDKRINSSHIKLISNCVNFKLC